MPEREIKPIVDVTVMQGARILMVQFAAPPDKQPGWFLPNDLIRHLEHPDKAAARVVSEQVGLNGTAPQLCTLDSFSGNDGSWHLAFHYVLKLDDASLAEAHPSVAQFRWFDMAGLPAEREVAHHGWYLDVVVRNLAKINS